MVRGRAPRIAAISRLVLPAATRRAFALARRERRGVHRGVCAGEPVEVRKMRPQGFGELELALAERARGAVEDEADEEPPVDVDRQRHGVADADRAVVVVAGFQERLLRDKVADPLGHRGRVAAMGADQRMLGEIAVEHFDLARRNRARGVAHHAAVVAVEVATDSVVSSEPITAASEATPRRAKPPAAPHSAPMAWSVSSAAWQIPTREPGHNE